MRNRYLIIAVLLLAQLPLWAKKKVRVPDSLQVITVKANGVEIRMQRVEGGSFVMGATPEQYDRDTYTDKPAHLVFLSPYYMAATEVTNRLWQAVMPDCEMLGPSGYPMHPVSFVSWIDAQEFVRRLDSLTGYPFRLPTEAEWEYAARGGKKSKGYKFSGGNDIDDVAWYDDNSGNWTHDVATKRANELGLYDMSGNVWEWCQDWLDPYSSNCQTNPKGAPSGSYRVSRGGSWNGSARGCRVSYRSSPAPSHRYYSLGLRLAL